MRFYKMNGAGNDFVIINNTEEGVSADRLPELARYVCDRHFSLGADGLMVVEKPEGDADLRMIFFNSDGSLGEMCGNGARCIARYGFETGLSGGRETVAIEAGAGKVSGERIGEREYRVRLNDPSLVELCKPLTLGGGWSGAAAGAPAPAPAPAIEGSYILLGDPGLPHLVVEYSGAVREWAGSETLAGVDRERLKCLGRALRYHPDLPKGANVSFCELIGPDLVRAITYERGVEDFTLACGTGAGSITLALTLRGLVSGRDVSVRMPGGTLLITIEDVAGASGIFLTGPADIAAIGELFWIGG